MSGPPFLFLDRKGIYEENNLDWENDIIGYELDFYVDKIKEEGVLTKKEFYKKHSENEARYFTYSLAVELLKRTGDE